MRGHSADLAAWLDQHGRTHDPELDQLRHTAAQHPIDLPTTPSEATVTTTRDIYRARLSLEHHQTVTLPRGAHVISAHARDGAMNAIDIWAEVDPQAEPADTTIWLVGTGTGEVPADARYIDTVQLQLGALVLHVYTDA